MLSTILIPLLASVAQAILITSPALNSTVAKGSTIDLTWTHVDTDPSTFGLLLVNFVTWPPSYVQLAADVPTAADHASVAIPCDTASSYGFQLNAINGTNVYVIYAQSPRFTVAGPDCVDPAPTTTPPASCPTVTVTVDGAMADPTEASATVPKTIGWHKGYTSPVTIPKVPTPPPRHGRHRGHKWE